MASCSRVLGLLCVLPLVSALGACAGPGDEGDEDGLPEPLEDAEPDQVPTDPEVLLAWLRAEPYLEWPAESAIHASTGPHFGNVRTWVNPALVDSLDAGDEQHPAGAATVKELYADGQTRRGWSVSIKLADDSEDGDQWLWYEWYDGAVLASGSGLSVCTGCHGSGVDFVRTPFPLQ